MARVPSPHQVWKLTEFLMKCTEPSVKQTFTPPGWRLFAEGARYGPRQPTRAIGSEGFWHGGVFGGVQCT
jgi:hypothetical protein